VTCAVGKEVSTIERDGEPWFVAKDLCYALEIGNSRQALSRLDDDEKGSVILNDRTSSGGNPNASIVNESGMCSLALSSRKQEAIVFMTWVTSDVLHTIRKIGRYDI
jgi:prophage antirepressor-like protein